MLLNEEMSNTMLEEQWNEAASATSEGHPVSEVGLPAGKIDRDIHDAVSDLVAVTGEMKYVHRTQDCFRTAPFTSSRIDRGRRAKIPFCAIGSSSGAG
jgi:hypothetical protein